MEQRQLREAVTQARRADAAKTDFLRRMSHDIRTPINGIRGMVEIARHYVGNEAKQEECREKIMVASGFLLELVNNVLDMNKLESGKVQLEAKTFCVRDLVEESAAMVEAQTAEKTLTLRRDIRCDRSDRVIGSPLHVRQVLQNLLSNAVRYNRVGGEIFLSARETARTEETVAYEFVVRDTGVGMSEAFQQRAFEPFAQEDASARSSYTGTGLGLAIVKELVEKMDGTIRLESRKGAGTTFTVCLTFTRDRQARRDEGHGRCAGLDLRRERAAGGGQRDQHGDCRIHARQRGRGRSQGGQRAAGGGDVQRLRAGRNRRDFDGCDDAGDERAGGDAADSRAEPAGRADGSDFRDDGQRLCRRRGAQPKRGHERASDQADRRGGADPHDCPIRARAGDESLTARQDDKRRFPAKRRIRITIPQNDPNKRPEQTKRKDDSYDGETDSGGGLRDGP